MEILMKVIVIYGNDRREVGIAGMKKAIINWGNPPETLDTMVDSGI